MTTGIAGGVFNRGAWERKRALRERPVATALAYSVPRIQEVQCCTEVCLCPDRSDRFFANGMLDPTAGLINYFPEGYTTDISIGGYCQTFADKYLCTDEDDEELFGRTLTDLWMRKHGKLCAAHRINDRDAQTLHSYTVECPLYKEINAAMRTACLRQLHSAEFKPHLDYIYHLDRALRSAVVLSADVTTLYRGITRKVSHQHYACGNTITWQAFSSTSAKLPVALEFACCKGKKEEKRPEGTVFIITDVKSAKGIAPWSQYPDEAEWLFGFNTQFHAADRWTCEAEVSKSREFFEMEGWDVSNLDFFLLHEV